MTSIIEDLLGNGLRILLLGSYDDITRTILHKLRKDLNERFERYACTTLLLENMDIHVSLRPGLHDYSVFFEKEGENAGAVTLIKEKTKPIERIEYKSEQEYQQSIGSGSGSIDFKHFRKVPELEKASILNDWADLVYLIKQLELTRGGELVELTYLLHRHRGGKSVVDPLKYEFFYKKEIEISTMVKEIVVHNKIYPIEYTEYEELRDSAFEVTERHISRLNTQLGRFHQFES